MVKLNPEQGKTFYETLNQAAFTERVATKVNVNENGVSIPLMSDMIVARIHENDDEKEVSTITLDSKDLKPQTLYTITEMQKRDFDPNSAEFTEYVLRRSANAISKEIDTMAVALLNTSTVTSPWDGTDVLESLTEGLAKADGTGFGADKWLFDSKTEVDFLRARDGGGNMLLGDVRNGIQHSVLLGREAVTVNNLVAQTSKTAGFTGQFTDNLVWGVRNNSLDVLVSKEGTANGRSAFSRNLVYIRVETEVVVGLISADRIVKLQRP